MTFIFSPPAPVLPDAGAALAAAELRVQALSASLEQARRLDQLAEYFAGQFYDVVRNASAPCISLPGPDTPERPLAETAGALSVRFEVRDSGHGLPPEVLTRRGGSIPPACGGPSPRLGGSGLSLNPSDGQVKQPGSHPAGAGPGSVDSCFAFVLTLSRAAATCPAAPAPSFPTIIA